MSGYAHGGTHTELFFCDTFPQVLLPTLHYLTKLDRIWSFITRLIGLLTCLHFVLTTVLDGFLYVFDVFSFSLPVYISTTTHINMALFTCHGVDFWREREEGRPSGINIARPPESSLFTPVIMASLSGLSPPNEKAFSLWLKLHVPAFAIPFFHEIQKTALGISLLHTFHHAYGVLFQVRMSLFTFQACTSLFPMGHPGSPSL